MYAIYVYCLCICLGLLLRCSKSLRLTFQAMGVLQCRVCCGCLTLPGAHLRTPVFTPLIVFHAFYPASHCSVFIKQYGQNYLEKGMAIHSSILAWRIPWTEELGGLQSVGSQRVVHN